MRQEVLDHGFVRLIDHMGTDLTVVNAARVSFGKRKEELDSTDEGLVKYLATHAHTAPFRHVYLTFHVKAPIFVFRQWMKHRVASDFNEISGRYVDLSQVDIFVPSTFRKPAKTNKQGSEGLIDPDNFVPAMQSYIAACKESVKQYNNLISLGVCKEQARCILPLGIYSEVYWTASLQAVAHFCALREDEHAQWEIRQYAITVRDMVQALFPKTFPALLKAETLTLAALKDTEL